MDSLSEQDKADAREEFENQLRYAFVKFDYPEEDEEPSEVGFSSNCIKMDTERQNKTARRHQFLNELYRLAMY
ncbi:unnamed protein product [Parnassius apollo]|uniref:(apollo) hypothetical protein n=1 Tax=Parnassius apollo TaxID=110799 RepID=A0A8S3XRZ1_PARAO|nr:unnamed protein product [Parnassius apollo]